MTLKPGRGWVSVNGVLQRRPKTTTPPPPPPPPPPLPETTVTVTELTATTARISWTAVTGATGYLVGRNGTDNQGNGPWETTEPVGVTSREFVWLVTGQAYTLYVEPQPGGVRKTVTVTPEDNTPPPPPVTYGALTVGQANYPVPGSNVSFASPSGSDTNPGTLTAPFRTLSKATSVVAANGTIVLRGGTYNEGRTRTTGTNLGYVAISVGQPGVTIQNYPGEAVWLDGSTAITGFVADGSWWSRAWTPFRRDPQYGWASQSSYDAAVASNNYRPLDHPGPDQVHGTADDIYWNFVDYTNFPAAARPERVWINGVQQTQVVTLAAMGVGKFFIDAQTNKLYVGENPAGKTVEITNQQTLLNLLADDCTIRGIGIRRYAGSNPQGGVVKLHRAAATIENVHMEDVTPFGIDCLGSSNNIGPHDTVINHVTLRRIGNLGIHGDMSDRVSVTHSLFQFCNDKRFAYAPSAGSIKITRSRNWTVDQNRFEDSYGKFFWLDIDCIGGKFTVNYCTRSYQRGLVIEMSDDVIVAGNVFYQTAIDAIAPVDCCNAKVWNNTIILAGWRRNQPDMSMTDWFSNPRAININRSDRLPHGTVNYDGDPRSGVSISAYPRTHVGSVSLPNQIRNNVIVHPNTQMFIGDEDFRKNQTTPSALSGVNAGTNFDYNLYQKNPAYTIQFPWNMSNTGSGNTTASTIAAARTTWSMELNGQELPASATMIVDPASGQLVTAHQGLHASALALPADIAAAIGQPTGAKHFGAFPLT